MCCINYVFTLFFVLITFLQQDVEKFTDIEKLYLYLKLPSGPSNGNDKRYVTHTHTHTLFPLCSSAFLCLTHTWLLLFVTLIRLCVTVISLLVYGLLCRGFRLLAPNNSIESVLRCWSLVSFILIQNDP